MPSFLERTEAKQANQLDNFGLKIGGYSGPLDVTPAEVASSAADAAFFRWLLIVTNAVDAMVQGITEYKVLVKRNPKHLPLATFPALVLPVMPAVVPGGILERFTNLGKRIKLHPNYTHSIGEDLQIIGDDSHFDPETYKPVLKAISGGTLIRLEFVKHGVDSLNIYYRKRGDSAWIFSAKVSRSPFDEHFQLTANPGESASQQYEFYAKGVMEDKEIGLDSEIVTGVITQ